MSLKQLFSKVIKMEHKNILLMITSFNSKHHVTTWAL